MARSSRRIGRVIRLSRFLALAGAGACLLQAGGCIAGLSPSAASIVELFLIREFVTRFIF